MILIHICEELLDAVTIPILKKYLMKDAVLKKISKTVKEGSHLSRELAGQSFGEYLMELSVVEEGILMRRQICHPKEVQKENPTGSTLGTWNGM